MKKVLTSILVGALALFSLDAFGQLGVNVAYLNNAEHAKVEGGRITFDGDDLDWNGVYAGVDYNIALPFSGLSVDPGVGLNFLFTKDGDVKSNNIFLQVPVDIRYNLELASDVKFFAGVGPRFNLGLSRTSSYEGEKSDNAYGENQFKKFTVAAGATIGAELAGKLRIAIGYDHSLGNVFDNENLKYSHSIIKIGVGYLF